MDGLTDIPGAKAVCRAQANFTGEQVDQPISRVCEAAARKAEKRKAGTVQRVRKALYELRLELDRAKTQPEAALPPLTLESIANQAQLDRKTLNLKHHAALKKEVLDFIAEHKPRSPDSRPRPRRSRIELVSLAHEQIAIENRMLRKQVAELAAKVATLESTATQIRSMPYDLKVVISPPLATAHPPALSPGRFRS